MFRSTVSVVIPAYNAQACLRETLESVLAQSRQADEIIVIDDGSKDATEAVARSFGDRIRYIKQQNTGIAGARNAGIREASSEWIAFLDHDDLMFPQKLAVEMQVAESRTELMVVYSAFTFLYSDGKRHEMPSFPAQELWPALRYRTPILPSTALVRRSALIEIGGFKNVYCVDDWSLWFRLVQRYSKDAFQEVAESLTLYRWWENNESKNVLPMTGAALSLLDTLLLSDLKGIPRAMWKRRVEARLFYRLAVDLREANHERYWEFAIESFLRWPLFGKIVPAYRYKVLAHMLWTRLRHFHLDFRYWWPRRKSREGLARV
ncbi:Glycosyltransferase involved in cell wall bisynthesis [Granulicella pectinivorans]|uniref:Glycosyltransferase involved in cell wall bisynthesis n=1 Tax=Granulicella pectinivorans TaxID=474950 RepID=A0A1I6MM50_9BACT|nr:glycosyltransferase family 2 protein [Granulicella pectinivorans]SFS16770.1 Glycosyltransferase involved in cell wall bisynthesis [Granulicella pectinivorans]